MRQGIKPQSNQTTAKKQVKRGEEIGGPQKGKDLFTPESGERVKNFSTLTFALEVIYIRHDNAAVQRYFREEC